MVKYWRGKHVLLANDEVCHSCCLALWLLTCNSPYKALQFLCDSKHGYFVRNGTCDSPRHLPCHCYLHKRNSAPKQTIVVHSRTHPPPRQQPQRVLQLRLVLRIIQKVLQAYPPLSQYRRISYSFSRIPSLVALAGNVAAPPCTTPGHRRTPHQDRPSRPAVDAICRALLAAIT